MIGCAAVGGVQMVQLGLQWAVFSPLSGETHLINNECAAIFEVIQGCGVADSSAIARVLAEDTGLGVDELRNAVDDVWPALLGTGLIRQANSAESAAA